MESAASSFAGADDRIPGFSLGGVLGPLFVFSTRPGATRVFAPLHSYGCDVRVNSERCVELGALRSNRRRNGANRSNEMRECQRPSDN